LGARGANASDSQKPAMQTDTRSPITPQNQTVSQIAADLPLDNSHKLGIQRA